MPILAMMRTKFDFEGKENEELSFQAGEVIYLLHRDESGWAKGRKPNGARGWFPIEFAEVVQSVEDEKPKKPDAPEGTTQSAHPSFKEEDEEERAHVQQIPESERPRYHVAREIMTTEKTYSSNLNKILKFWLNPIKEGNMLESKQISCIFCNVEEIAAVSNKFLPTLESKINSWSVSSTMGDAFLQVLPDFGVYVEYLKNHHLAIATVNSLKDKRNFGTWMQSVREKKEMEGLDLLAFLIMPVQRILRYKLLLEDLLRHTRPDHPDRLPVSNSLKAILEIAENVNESIKEEENFQKLCRIQKSFGGNVKNIVVEDRKFIREGPLMKICRKTDKARWFFLFNDVLVYASVAGSNKNVARTSIGTSMGQRMFLNPKNQSNTKFMFHRMINLETTRVKPVPDSLTLKNAFQIITTEEKSFTVYTETAEEKEAWLKDFGTYIHSSENEEVDSTAAPVWVPDKLAKNCNCCGKSFNVVQRRHHCRNCGQVVCGSCSKEKIPLAHSSIPVRVCKTCFDDYNKDYRDSENSDGHGTQSGRKKSRTNLRELLKSGSFAPLNVNGAATPMDRSTNLDSTRSLEAPDSARSLDSARSMEPEKESPPSEPHTDKEAVDRKEEQDLPKVSSLEQVGSATSSPTAPSGNEAKPPPKPQLPKPPIKPKSLGVQEQLDLLKKKMEDLAKQLAQERASRRENEQKLANEIVQLRSDNDNLRNELAAIREALNGGPPSH